MSPARRPLLAAVVASITVAIGALGAVAALGAGAHAGGAPRLVSFIRYSASSTATAWLRGASGGKPTKLGDGDAALVSPNGAMVAVAGPGGRKLTIYSTSGGAPKTFTTPTSASPQPLAWSPDSRYLALGLSGTEANGVTGSGLAIVDTSDFSYTVLAKGVIYGASFAVDGSDRIVYGLSHRQLFTAPVNLYEIAPDGSGATQITTNGASLNPIWGARGIAFDRERLLRNAGPVYQIWLINGNHLRQLTHVPVGILENGITPLGFSADGNRMIALYAGTDNASAWTIQLNPLRVRELIAHGQSVQPGQISRNGDWVLVDTGGLEPPVGQRVVESVPFGGGKPIHKLGSGVYPSWNF